MSMNVNEMKGSFDNLARPNRFQVSGLGVDGDIEFRAQAASLPSTEFGVVEVPYQGRTIKIPGDRSYSEWTITVQQDDEATIRKAMEDWMFQANASIENTGQINVSEWKRDSRVEQYDRGGNVIIAYDFIGCWPSQIGEISLDWSENDSIATFDLTIQFDYFVRA